MIEMTLNNSSLSNLQIDILKKRERDGIRLISILYDVGEI